MRLEHLISAVNAEPENLINKMNLATDAVLINQCGKNSEETITRSLGGEDSFSVRVFSFDEKGVGLSRNRAIEKALGDIVLFTDDDIVYEDGYVEKVLKEFENHPEADGLFFNVNVCEERRTYFNNDFKRVHVWNGGRYPAYSIALRREALLNSKVKFSPLFGGGAKYSCGEDSLFIRDLLKAGLKLYRTPVVIASEEPRPSTWFTGYDEKFFFDRGVLYHFLYGALAPVMGFRFVYTKKAVMCNEISSRKAFALLRKGIKEGKDIT